LIFILAGLAALLVIAGIGLVLAYQLMMQGGRLVERIDELGALERKDGTLPVGAATDVLLAPGDLAPAFALRDRAGLPRDLDYFRGQRLLLTFVDGGSVFSQELLYELNALQEEPDNVRRPVPVVIFTSPDAGNERLREAYPRVWFARTNDDKEIAHAYAVDATPAGYVVEADGKLGGGLIVGRQALRQRAAGFEPDASAYLDLPLPLEVETGLANRERV
jgi:hypothetical protein